ncbi:MULTISPECIES: hypothetical protein [unclassified Cobetia]|uniref:hypothetical protein n=1 Tax=unclassified Cobetia TaxID=2609414 RepID=UPI00178CB727|nr:MULTISPECIES: hypothetical protein [unclassified Cobetia]MBE2170225.1 hypothetical protein [Cobetia sp. 2AS1]MDH2446992.1 hypothetical protein [Cobetia sp. 2AS]
MSDFIFTSKKDTKNNLVNSIEKYCLNKRDEVFFFNGVWGSLLLTKGWYYGYDPIETEQYICAVIGGPVLTGKNNNFENANSGSELVLGMWLQGVYKWDEVLSGPFIVIIVNKKSNQMYCITDLMMFLPVYSNKVNGDLALASHVDLIADYCNEIGNIDEVSSLDFIIHGCVTYPYTIYRNIKQLNPASVHAYPCPNSCLEKCSKICEDISVYWEPSENNIFPNIIDAAQYLREGIESYIRNIIKDNSNIAQFISAGEDSRALAGILPISHKRDAFIFLDKMNREGKIANKVANVFGLNFIYSYRSSTHYLDIISEASKLVGTGHQYTHAHSLRFDKINNLNSYDAVFGGLGSDTLLKLHFANKDKKRTKFPFLPQKLVSHEKCDYKNYEAYFSLEIIDLVKNRRDKHFHKLMRLRPNSAAEWMCIWPATMYIDIPNLYCNRRLFPSYEVFMCNASVKVASAAPTNWKINRQLFLRAFKPSLKTTKFMLHADGRLPYYSWKLNLPIHSSIWLYRKVKKKITNSNNNEGPWGEWNNVVKTSEWENNIYKVESNQFAFEIDNAVRQNILLDEKIPIISKVNLMQLYVK